MISSEYISVAPERSGGGGGGAFECCAGVCLDRCRYVDSAAHARYRMAMHVCRVAHSVVYLLQSQYLGSSFTKSCGRSLFQTLCFSAVL